jgi:hypothetical protein
MDRVTCPDDEIRLGDLLVEFTGGKKACDQMSFLDRE